MKENGCRSMEKKKKNRSKSVHCGATLFRHPSPNDKECEKRRGEAGTTRPTHKTSCRRWRTWSSQRKRDQTRRRCTQSESMRTPRACTRINIPSNRVKPKAAKQQHQHTNSNHKGKTDQKRGRGSAQVRAASLSVRTSMRGMLNRVHFLAGACSHAQPCSASKQPRVQAVCLSVSVCVCLCLYVSLCVSMCLYVSVCVCQGSRTQTLLLSFPRFLQSLPRTLR